MKKAKIDDSYRLWAADTQLQQLHALCAEIEGVKVADDIENIHRMRVASRRMRAAFDIFKKAYPRKDRAIWKAQIKAVTKTLGAARDCDVQMEYLEEYLQREGLDKSHRPGLERLLLRLTQKRESLQPAVIASMETLEASGVIDTMTQSWRQIRVQARLANIPQTSAPMYVHAHNGILRCLEEMLVFECVVDQPEQVEQLHEMRIMSKALRYTMEAFEGIYHGKLKSHIKTVKEVQSLLGDIHDADVWCDDLELFIEEERQRTIEYFGEARGFARLEKGLRHMITERRAERHQIYVQFRDFWHKLEKKGVFSDLRQLLIDSMETPPTPKVAKAPKPKTPKTPKSETTVVPDAPATPEAPADAPAAEVEPAESVAEATAIAATAEVIPDSSIEKPDLEPVVIKDVDTPLTESPKTEAVSDSDDITPA